MHSNVESTIQINCVKWFRLAYPNKTIFAIPNGGKRSVITATILKAEGTLAGVADLFLVHASKGYNGLFIEMKTEVGRQSLTQQMFDKSVTFEGYKYAIARNFDEFRHIIQEYID